MLLLYLQMLGFIDITVIIVIIIIIIIIIIFIIIIIISIAMMGGTLFLKKSKIWLVHFCNKENNKNTEYRIH